VRDHVGDGDGAVAAQPAHAGQDGEGAELGKRMG